MKTHIQVVSGLALVLANLTKKKWFQDDGQGTLKKKTGKNIKKILKTNS